MVLSKQRAHRPEAYIRMRVLAAESLCRLIPIIIKLSRKFLPKTIKAKIIVCNSGFIIKDTYYCLSNAGLFSIASTVYTDLALADVPVREINTVFGAILYKKYFFQNVWPHFFNIPIEACHLASDSNVLMTPFPPAVGWWCLDYLSLPIEEIHFSTNKHFAPSAQVLAVKDEILKKYEIISSKVIAVHYRGTDKIKETNEISFHRYTAEIDKAITRNPEARILLQVDERVILERLLEHYGQKSFCISELPPSGGKIGAHYLRKDDPIQDAITYFAIILILSQSDTLITHTGNGALWEFIFRKTSDNFVQLRS